MSFDHDHLVWKALVALDEVVHESRRNAVEGSFALRFVLAFLHATGKGERRLYDDFWKTVRDPYTHAYHGNQASYLRGTYAQTALNAISRDQSIELTVAVAERLASEHRRNKRHRFPETKKGPT